VRSNHGLQTAEGTRAQLRSSAGSTHAVVVSTIMEAWRIVEEGLVADGTVKDVRSSSVLRDWATSSPVIYFCRFSTVYLLH